MAYRNEGNKANLSKLRLLRLFSNYIGSNMVKIPQKVRHCCHHPVYITEHQMDLPVEHIKDSTINVCNKFYNTYLNKKASVEYGSDEDILIVVLTIKIHNGIAMVFSFSG